MTEEEIIKLINPKSQAIEENLLLATELTEVKEKLNNFFDQNIKGEFTRITIQENLNSQVNQELYGLLRTAFQLGAKNR